MPCVTAQQAFHHLAKRIGQLRKIGLIGGLSWHSTRSYYEFINRGVEPAHGIADQRADAAIDWICGGD